MRPPVTEQHSYYKLMNVLCRVMGLWFVFVCSTAMLVPILGLVIAGLGAKQENTFYYVQMIAGFGVGIALGGVALKVRSFRPDLPRPKPGESTNWWTGDLAMQTASKDLTSRLSPIVRLALALASLIALVPIIFVLGIYGLVPLEVTGIPRSSDTIGVGVIAGAIFVTCWALVISGWNPVHRE